MGSKVISGPELPPAIPNLQALKHAEASLVQSLPDVGLGLESVQSHLVNDITPGFSGSSLSPNYYGVATGAVTEPALFADRLASTYDQNIQVHLPAETVATRVEDTALRLVSKFRQRVEFLIYSKSTPATFVDKGGRLSWSIIHHWGKCVQCSCPGSSPRICCRRSGTPSDPTDKHECC
jgi:hypothetical protein